ncbi:transposase [Candidatus Magnetaquicoccus inordinatus]|uniref:transposase n=1 Tax=Candidatus Magnetaquicoccus inordinatus TaxID=2496818 RepID=UPI001D0E79D4|nr:transposase [Candidatus Magnetaquicoccus inordinatus]
MPETRLIYLADREGDIYDIFFEREEFLRRDELAADWLIRFRDDRNTIDGQKLKTVVENAPEISHVEFDLAPARGRKKRHVVQTLRVARVVLNPPRRTGKKFAPVEITALLASEETPPAGEDPIEWLLLSGVHVETAEQAEEILQWYMVRWQVEIFFRILKDGCKIEKLQLEHDRENRGSHCSVHDHRLAHFVPDYTGQGVSGAAV